MWMLTRFDWTVIEQHLNEIKCIDHCSIALAWSLASISEPVELDSSKIQVLLLVTLSVACLVARWWKTMEMPRPVSFIFFFTFFFFFFFFFFFLWMLIDHLITIVKAQFVSSVLSPSIQVNPAPNLKPGLGWRWFKTLSRFTFSPSIVWFIFEIYSIWLI